MQSRPHGLRCIIETASEERTYGIGNGQQLIVFRPDGRLSNVPIQSRIENLDRLSCGTWDSRRNRIVVAASNGPNDLFAFDIGMAQWSHIGRSGRRLAAIEYDSQNDVFYGLPLSYYHAASGQPTTVSCLELINATGEGKHLSGHLIKLSHPVPGDRLMYGGVQSELIDGKLVFVLPPGADPDRPDDTLITVIDAETGKVLHCEVAHIHPGSDGQGKGDGGLIAAGPAPQTPAITPGPVQPTRLWRQFIPGKTYGQWEPPKLQWFRGRFTFDGPVYGSRQPVPPDTTMITEGPEGETLFIVSDDKLMRLDAESGAPVAVPPDPSLPEINRPVAMTCDRKRGRILIATSGSDAALYSYHVERNCWSINSLGRRDLDGLVWLSERDSLLGFSFAYPLPAVTRLSPQGAVIEVVALQDHLPGVLADAHRIQLSEDGPNVLVIADPLYDSSGREPSRIHLIDPLYGFILASSSSSPQIDTKDLTDGELSQMWESILTADDEFADRLAWRMAAGGDRAVTFLSRMIPMGPKAGPRRTVAEAKQLIARLSSPSRAERDASHGRLMQLGTDVVPYLKQALKDATPDGRDQIYLLLRKLDTAIAKTQHERRHMYGMFALERIGTKAAVSQLRRLATGLEYSWTVRDACDALKRLQSK